MASRHRSSGFTIVELMIAISTFSIAIILITSGVIFIGRQYKQATTRVDLENAVRETHQQIGQSIQFSGGSAILAAANGYGSHCFGDKQYIYGETAPSYDASIYDAVKPGLFVSDVTPGQCPPPPVNPTGVNLLPEGAKVIKFEYAGSQLSTVFAYSASDLLNIDAASQPPDQVLCKAGVAGKEYCAVVQLDSIAVGRVTN